MLYINVIIFFSQHIALNSTGYRIQYNTSVVQINNLPNQTNSRDTVAAKSARMKGQKKTNIQMTEVTFSIVILHKSFGMRKCERGRNLSYLSFCLIYLFNYQQITISACDDIIRVSYLE